jgi:peroxiredoxin
MRTAAWKRLSVASLVAAGLVGVGIAAEKKAELKVGDKAPAWKALEGTDGKKHAMDDVAKAKAVVVVFTCNHCPVAVAYEERLAKFAKEHKEKGVETIAINVNNLEEDKLPAMKKRWKEKEWTFTYLYDPSQAIGRAYGAKVTPHWYVLDSQRNVAYIGAFDDNQDAAQATKRYVVDAVDAVLAGKKPATAGTKAFGCGIKYDSQ